MARDSEYTSTSQCGYFPKSLLSKREKWERERVKGVSSRILGLMIV